MMICLFSVVAANRSSAFGLPYPGLPYLINLAFLKHAWRQNFSLAFWLFLGFFRFLF